MQRMSLDDQRESEIRDAVAQIIIQAEPLVTENQQLNLAGPYEGPEAEFLRVAASGNRFMLFPLFLAGIEVREDFQRAQIDQGLERLERSSLGQKVGLIRRLLAEIQAIVQDGQEVDWIDYMSRKGYRLIFFDF